MPPLRVNLGDALRSSFNAIKRHPFEVLFLLPAFMGASIALNLLVESVGGALPHPASMVITITGLLLAHIYVTALITRALLLLSKGQPLEVGVIASPHGLVWLGLVIVLTQLMVIAGIIALIIPGIIFGIVYSFAPYIVLERGFGPIAALKESATLTRGIRMELLWAALVLAMVTILGLLFFIVGFLFTAPLAALGHVYLYRQAVAKAGPHPQDDHGKGTEYVLYFTAAVLSLGLMALAYMSKFDVRSFDPAAKESFIHSLNAETQKIFGSQLAAPLPLGGGTAGTRYRSAAGISFVVPTGMEVESETFIYQQSTNSSWQRIVLGDVTHSPQNPRILLEVRPHSWLPVADDAIIDFVHTEAGFVPIGRLESYDPKAAHDQVTVLASWLVANEGSVAAYLWHDEKEARGALTPESLYIGLIKSLVIEKP